MHLLSEIHFWSLQDDIVVKHTDFGVFKYFHKKDSNDVAFTSKKLYSEKRGLTWCPANKRPFKVKDKLREFEEHLSQSRVVFSRFKVNEVDLLLAKGIIVTISTNLNLSDLTNISFNKTLAPKIQSELICDGVISGQQIACICTDGRVFCLGGTWKEEWVIDGGSKRRISLHDELLCIWGRVNAEHPQPWTPIKDYQKANLLVYWVGLKGPELLAHKKTEGEPIEIIISKVQNKVVISVEQKVSLRGAVSVEVNSFEILANNLKKQSVISVPLQTQVSSCSLSNDESRLVLGCIDGSIALLNRQSGSTQIIKTTFIPTFAAWHKDGAIFAVSNEKGQVQYFDAALNNVGFQLFGEESSSLGLDLSGYFNMQLSVTTMIWGTSNLFISLEHGPIVVVAHLERCLDFPALSLQYLKSNKVQKAIRLLLAWQWNDDCFNVLQKIVTHLLRLPLTEDNAQNLQDALSSFHSSSVPFDHSMKHKYGRQVRALTRRFFYQLVRYKMFDIAFLLAVDIGHHDLFMDLYYCAIDIGEKEMAAAARAQASALLSKCSSEVSYCSHSSCSQCSDSYSESSEDSFKETKAKPPQSKLLLQLPQTDGNLLSTNFNDFEPLPPKPIVIPKPIKMPPPLPIAPPLPITPAPPPIAPPLSTLSFPSRFNKMQTFAPSSNLQLQNRFTPSFDIKPLHAQPASTSQTPFMPPQPVISNIGKKPQAKVKFSDTVTAFIVPEVKRPVRPTPPAHITNPQKELADSLPLCHPNEDYLKDFTPIRRNENDEDKPSQPKIKVVHFGVV